MEFEIKRYYEEIKIPILDSEEFEIKKDLIDVVAKCQDEKGIYKIGLGIIELADEELQPIAQIKYEAIKLREANPSLPTYQELRAKEYLAQGITIDKMVIAIWERVVENRSEAANLLQAKREAVKAKIPKV